MRIIANQSIPRMLGAAREIFHSGRSPAAGEIQCSALPALPALSPEYSLHAVGEPGTAHTGNPDV